MSETLNDLGQCDSCDKPATTACFDVIKRENWITRHYEREPLGPVKRGCDDHPVESIEHIGEAIRPRPEGEQP
jgi:hypothetical protein